MPVGADTRVTWSVDNETVGTIDATGLFTALAEGTVNVIARSAVDPTIYDTATVTVLKLPGDVNRDGKVDASDLALVAGAFNIQDPAADLNQDGIVDIFGLVLVGKNFKS